MECTDYHELISSYLDDELPKEETKDLLAHLEHCERCTEELTKFSVQKARIASLRALYAAPDPDIYFAQRVMARIDALSSPQPSPVRLFLNNLISDLLLPFRKPAVALPLVLLLTTGIITGFFLQSLSNRPGQQLLSVYELPTQPPSPQIANVAKAEDETQSHLFDHFADSSVETVAASPCLMEYAAYTCTAGAEDH